MNNFDVIIVGAGPAGIFTALETLKHNPSKKIAIFEKGNSIEKRICPKRKTDKCVDCNPCNITTGFSGAGAYSDGKLTLSHEVGGNLPDYIPVPDLQTLIKYTDDIYLSYKADDTVYDFRKLEGQKYLDYFEIKQKAIQNNMKLIDAPVRHLGTEKAYDIYEAIQKELLAKGVKIFFRTMIEHLLVTDDGQSIKGLLTTKGDEYYAPKVVVAVGREGSGWFEKACKEINLKTLPGVVDIGVRVEVRNEIMKKVNETLYEGKLVYYTPTFDDKVRTFCQNPSGVVATEIYEDGDETLAVVNGHSYKDDKYKTENTNFALLVSKHFTEPFKDPIKYGKYIARLGNMLSGNKIIVQRFGDFRRGRRTTESRLYRNNIIPTLKDAVPGDLSLVLPHRIMTDLREMIESLDHVYPGVGSDETLLYGVEVKFYSNRVPVDNRFETKIKGLFAAGDGAGITRGLMQASVNGVLIGRNLF